MRSAGAVPRRSLALFTALYAVQGVVVAYFFNFNKNYMIGRGVAPEVVAGVETLALLPFVFKFLVGPVSDRFSPFGLGHRLPYICLGLVIQAAGLVGLAAVDPGRHLPVFGALAFATVVGLALYDTACDGLVVDVTPPRDRPRVQGALFLSRFLATMLFTYGFGLWLDREGQGGLAGVPGVLGACAVLGLLPLTLARGVDDPSRLAGCAERFQWAALRSLGRPWTLLLLVYGAWYAMIGVGAEINLSAAYKDVGLGPGAIGRLGAIRYAGRAAGALLFPIAARRVGRLGLLFLGLGGLIATTAAQAGIDDTPVTAGLTFAFGAANGWNDALFCVLAMEAADPRMAASTFALVMAVSNLSVVGDLAFAKAERVLGGFPAAYLAAAAMLVPLAALAVPLGRWPSGVRRRREVPDGPTG